MNLPTYDGREKWKKADSNNFQISVIAQHCHRDGHAVLTAFLPLPRVACEVKSTVDNVITRSPKRKTSHISSYAARIID